MSGEAMSDAWRRFRERTDLDEYDSRWDRLAAAGEHVHGEADFVMGLQPRSVLDAGCGTGRVAIELARRGVEVLGVDADPDMLERARRRAPSQEWVVADLATLDLARTFDVVVLAGNVLPFVEPDDRRSAVERCAVHLRPGGWFVAGASLQPGWPTVEELDRWTVDAGLEPAARYAGWDGEPWTSGARYAVTVCRRAASGDAGRRQAQ